MSGASGSWIPVSIIASPPSFRAVLGVHVLRHGLADLLPFPSFLRARERIDPALVVGGFALEFPPALEAIGRQRPVQQGGGDRATGLAVVTAIAEPAASDQLVEVGEGLVEPI